MNPENNNQSQQGVKFIYCTNCGTRIENEGSFCPECGAKIVRTQESDLQNTPIEVIGESRSSRDDQYRNYTEIPVNTVSVQRLKKKRFPKWAIVLLVLVVLGMFSSGTGNKSSNSGSQVAAVQQTATPAPTSIPTPVPTPEPTPEPQVNAAELVNNGDYSLVTPEFKQWMDSYEAFFDKYIAFMQKYTSSEGELDLNILTEYMSMLEELEKWSTWEENFDESTLSPADDAYYLLVNMRVLNKLANASLQME